MVTYRFYSSRCILILLICQVLYRSQRFTEDIKETANLKQCLFQVCVTIFEKQDVLTRLRETKDEHVSPEH